MFSSAAVGATPRSFLCWWTGAAHLIDHKSYHPMAVSHLSALQKVTPPIYLGVMSLRISPTKRSPVTQRRFEQDCCFVSTPHARFPIPGTTHDLDVTLNSNLGPCIWMLHDLQCTQCLHLQMFSLAENQNATIPQHN